MANACPLHGGSKTGSRPVRVVRSYPFRMRCLSVSIALGEVGPGTRAKNPCQSVAYGDCIRRAPGGQKTASVLHRVPERGENRSDEKNPVENPKANEQELSPKELESMSAGSISLNYSTIQWESQSKMTPGARSQAPINNRPIPQARHDSRINPPRDTRAKQK